MERMILTWELFFIVVSLDREITEVVITKLVTTQIIVTTRVASAATSKSRTSDP